MTSWITCQLGAREHYAIPRALYQADQLHTLITDAWVAPHSCLQHLPSKVGRSLTDRYHSDLATAPVKAFTSSLISFELRRRLARITGWPSILARNYWLQRHALRTLQTLESRLPNGERPILFSYSYTALEFFRYAQQRGWQTILGQIDPGPIEEQQVAQLQATYGKKYRSNWSPAPEVYWRHWRQEYHLADHILVNSPWSKSALITAGAPNEKIAVVPLAYQRPVEAENFTRHYPPAFTQRRPLRVLFLGQIILRKGIVALLEAIPFLSQAPVEIWLIGSTELTIPASLLEQYPQLKWLGSVPRCQVHQYYQQADIFLFPTHSDGFGLTQLEAQAWQLPIIASFHCGEVVRHMQNGMVLPYISGKSIADALLTCLGHPHLLKQWAQQATNMDTYSLSQLAETLNVIAHANV